MPLYLHGDEGMTYACPECGKAGEVWRRTHPNRNYTYPFRCHSCGSEFEDPVERRKSAGGGRGVARPRSQAAQALMEADPDDLVTDGGSEGECDRCHTETTRTTLTGEFRCESCARHVARRNRNSSREAGQDDLDEYATDGGRDVDDEREFFVIDEAATTVTAGPFTDEDDARDAVGKPSEIIATRAVLELIEATSTATLRWANGDGPDVVTDGGVISSEDLEPEGAYYCTHCETRFERADYDDPAKALEDARDCALSHAEKSAVRFDPQLEEDDYQPVDDEPELITDGGEDIKSKWTLECMDCDKSETFKGTEHPAEGPPEEVQKEARLHKNVTDESHIVRVKGTHVVEDQDVDPSLLTDGGVPDFDRVAVGTCQRCRDEVPIRFLEDDVCVGCVYSQPIWDKRTSLADGGRIVSRCDICHDRPAEGLLGDGRDACRRCADRVTRESRTSRRPVATDGGRDVESCPRCDGPMAAVAIAGPGEARVAPCGCEVTPQELPEFSSEPLRTVKVLPENLPGHEHDELALNLSRVVADYINAENPQLEAVASVYFATAFNFNRDVGVGEEAMLSVLLKHVEAEDLDLEGVNEVVDGDLRVTRNRGLVERVREVIR